MRASLARILLVYVPLLLLLLVQAVALLTLFAGKISGKNDTMIDLGRHVPVLRFGWLILFLIALIYHRMQRNKTASRKEL